MSSLNLGETQGKPDFEILFEDFPHAVPELARIIAEDILMIDYEKKFDDTSRDYHLLLGAMTYWRTVLKSGKDIDFVIRDMERTLDEKGIKYE